MHTGILAVQDGLFDTYFCMPLKTIVCPDNVVEVLGSFAQWVSKIEPELAAELFPSSNAE